MAGALTATLQAGSHEPVTEQVLEMNRSNASVKTTPGVLGAWYAMASQRAAGVYMKTT